MSNMLTRVAMLQQTARDTADLPDRISKLEAQLKALSDSVAQVEPMCQGDVGADGRVGKASETMGSLHDDKIGELRKALTDLQESARQSFDALKQRADNLQSKLG